MRLKSIVIILDIEDKDLWNHAKELKFEEEMWLSTGPTYPRVNGMMKEVFDIIKNRLGK